jgi:hypothetical protein
MMQRQDVEKAGLTAQDSLHAIYTTMDEARSSMYVAGSSTILILWAAVVSVGLGAQHFIMTLAPEFADASPWIFGVLWGCLVLSGMAGSGIIGHRASKKIAAGDEARRAGIRVFLYWLAVVAAMFLIPAAAGMWNAEDGQNIPRVAIGIASLAYILFGIMHHAALATVGVGFAAAFYIPIILLGDAAMPVSGMLMLAVVALGWAWIRRSGVL